MLFIGDIAGREVGAWVAERLPGPRAEHAADLVIANAENMSFDPNRGDGQGEFGMTLPAVERLFAAGVGCPLGDRHLRQPCLGYQPGGHGGGA